MKVANLSMVSVSSFLLVFFNRLCMVRFFFILFILVVSLTVCIDVFLDQDSGKSKDIIIASKGKYVYHFI